jgi:hypothetical protein
MNLLETLKQLKNIQADSSYVEKSRRIVLASPRHEPLSARMIFVRILETAGSLALVGVFIFAVAGGLSSSRYFSPVSFQGIDPAALHAEADAIDMQINIANLNYSQSVNVGESTAMTTPVVHAHESATSTSTPVVLQSTSTPVVSGATSTSSTALSVNEALQQLEQ